MRYGKLALIIFFALSWQNSQGQPALVDDINPGPEGQLSIIGQVRNGEFYFGADDGTSGFEPWLSDGFSTGTRQILDLNPGPDSSGPGFLGQHNGVLYFSADDGIEGTELWSLDLANFTNPRIIRPGPGSSSPGWAGVLGSRVLVTAQEATAARELYRVDGGSAQLWIDINMIGAGSRPGLFTPLDSSRALVRAGSATPPYNLAPHRVSVGSVETTATEITTTVQNEEHQLEVFFGFWKTINGYVFFGRDADALPIDSKGTEPWIVAGDSAQRVADVNPGQAGSFQFSCDSLNAVVFNGELYFTAYTPTTGLEVWVTNGASARILDDIVVGPDDAEPCSFREFDGELYFGAKTPSGPELWKTDGSTTTLVGRLSGNPNNAPPRPAGVFGDYLLIWGDTDCHGQEFWATDGTAIHRLTDLRPGSGDGVPRPFFWQLGNELVVFAGNDGEHGVELWRLNQDYVAAQFDLLFKSSFEPPPIGCP